MKKIIMIVVDEFDSDEALLTHVKQAMARTTHGELLMRYKHWRRGGLVSEQERYEYSLLCETDL